MTSDQFMANFGHVAMAPSGVKRLRELVLHLAVSGRLVPRKLDEGEGDAPIAEAVKLKDAYRAKHELRPSGSDKPFAENEQEFEIPAYWKWERLGNIACYIQRGKGPRYDDAGKTRVVSQKCVQWSGFDLSSARRISDDSVKDYSHERFLVNRDILWNSTGTGTAGRLVLYPGAKEQVVADSHVTIIRLTNFVPAYVWCYLFSPTIQQRMIPGQKNSMVTGTTNQVELSAIKVSELPIPCPPLAEQKRIVAKVDELMALCNQLEARQQERERRFPVLSRTCHARFAETPTPTNLNRIFDETGSVSPDDLRKTILALAVQGRIVSQNPYDEPAQEIVKRIRSEKAHRVASGQLKREKILPSVEVVPYDLPAGWCWSRIGNLSYKITSGSRDWAEHYSSEGAIFVRMGNLSRNSYQLRLDKIQRVKPPSNTEGDRTKLEFGDILISITGEVGLLGLIPEDFGEAYINQHVCLVRLPLELQNRFIAEFFRSTAAQEQFNEPQRGLKNSFRLTDVTTLLAPLPPIAEQHRIVAKVDELMALVDQLEAQHQERDKLAGAFAKACVASFTGTTQLERPEKMKAPKTELISLVTLGKNPKPDAKAPLAQLLIQNKGTLPAKSLWQQSGLTIDAFYQQLKTELAQGWIAPPAVAEMKVLEET